MSAVLYIDGGMCTFARSGVDALDEGNERADVLDKGDERGEDALDDGNECADDTSVALGVIAREVPETSETGVSGRGDMILVASGPRS